MKLNQITLTNIKGFVQAHFREILDSFDDLPIYIKEQTEWRLEQVKKNSLQCYKEDKCIHCGCQVSSKVFEDRGCSSNKCYPAMMDEMEWKAFKKQDYKFSTK